MKTQDTSDYRNLSDTEIVYNITNSDTMTKEFSQVIDQNEFVSIDDLFESLTPARKMVAKSAIELYKRLQKKKTEHCTIKMSNDIYEIMLPVMADLQHEEFWIVLLNQGGKVIKKLCVSSGGIDGTYADVRMILKHALLSNATQLAICHNHPSGNIQPSFADNKLTESIKIAAMTMNIRLIDHIIVSDSGYYSYADEGMIL